MGARYPVPGTSMDRLLEFAGNHLLLVAAFVILATLLIASFVRDAAGGRRLGPREAVRLINDRDARVVDLREKKDWDRGHIVDALHLPYAKLKSGAEGALPDKSQPLLLCCNSGTIASKAQAELTAAGYADVHVLKGGIMAWQADSLPLERA